MTHDIQIAKVKNGQRKSVVVDGVAYRSLNEMYSVLGISESTVANFKRTGMSLEEAISCTIDKAAERRKNTKKQWEAFEEEKRIREEKRKAAVFHFGRKTYPSFRRAVEDLSWENDIFLNPTSIKISAKKNNRSLEKQLQVTFDRHMKRKQREDRYYEKKYGIYAHKMGGETYYEIMETLKNNGISDCLSDEAVFCIAKNAGISKENAKELLEDVEFHESAYKSFDYENRDEIRKRQKEEYYGHIYGRWDFESEPNYMYYI